MILFSYQSFAQAPKCPSGYTYMPTVAAGDLLLVSDECLPDSVCKRLWAQIDTAKCTANDIYKEYIRLDNGSIVTISISMHHKLLLGQCVRTTFWHKKVNEKWGAITELEYIKLKND